MWELINNMTDQDVEAMEKNSVYINPVPSPASQCRISQGLPAASLVITIDTNATKQFSSREMTAMILHEIGQALNPLKRGMDGEFAADDYAVARGFKEDIISSLVKGIEIDPASFNNASTAQRIQRLRDLA